MSAIETTGTESAEIQAKRVAREFARHLGQSSSARAYLLAGFWYVVTSGTGEGVDFAYEPADIDGTFARFVIADEQQNLPAKFDYSLWCAEIATPVTDREVAVALYMQTEGVMGEGGTCTAVLTDDEIALLDLVKKVA